MTHDNRTKDQASRLFSQVHALIKPLNSQECQISSIRIVEHKARVMFPTATPAASFPKPIGTGNLELPRDSNNPCNAS